MKDIVIPEDLTALSDDELTDLGVKIREAAESLADDAATSDEALTAIETLVAEFDRVNGELASREAKAAERAERASSAIIKLTGDTDPAAGEDGTADEAETDEVSDIIEVAAATDDSIEFTSDEAQEAEVNDPTKTTAQVTSDLTAARPDGLEPVTEAAASGALLVASNAAPGTSEGTQLDTRNLAASIAKKQHGLNNASAGTYERIVLATGQSNLPNRVSGSAEDNFAIFDQVSKDWRSHRSQQTALVASGGSCAPLTPSYEFFRLAEALNPVESALPTVEAPRGGIRFITPPIWTQASPGVRVTTEAEDAAGYPPTEPKPCVQVECPPIEECRVDAVSQCVTFGNLNYRVFPEQVEAFLQDLSVAFTSTKEIAYLDGIDNASTAVTATPAYGATRGVTQTILAAAANYRRRQHMAPSAVLTLMLPSWVVEFIKVDMVNDHMMGLGFLNAGEAEVNAWLASANLDVAWYYDSATGAGQAFDDAQGAGAINPFPTSVVGYLFAPGTFVRLDGGTLDVGIVRDSTLNGTNDLQIFSEQWVQVCMVGLESLRLEITLCPDGTGPEPVVPLVCGGY
jgi:hypothetical protein